MSFVEYFKFPNLQKFIQEPQMLNRKEDMLNVEILIVLSFEKFEKIEYFLVSKINCFIFHWTTIQKNKMPLNISNFPTCKKVTQKPQMLNRKEDMLNCIVCYLQLNLHAWPYFRGFCCLCLRLFMLLDVFKCF